MITELTAPRLTIRRYAIEARDYLLISCQSHNYPDLMGRRPL